jgi:TonB family protein
MGTFSLSGVNDGDYLFKVEKDGYLPVYGAFHLAGTDPHNISVVMLDSASHAPGTVGAASPLRDSKRPPRSASKPPVVKPASVKKKVTPRYPDATRRVALDGAVKIAMIILPDGTVDDLVVLSSPNDSFAEAALWAVRLWQYSPTYLDGLAVEASLTVDVTFKH